MWKTPRVGGLGLLTVILLVVPLSFRNVYFYDVATNALFNAILCIGLNVLIGYAARSVSAMPAFSQ